MFDLGEISSAQFYQEYWRRKPLHLVGGAQHVLDRKIDAVEFRKICDRMQRARPELVSRLETSTFAQNMNVGCADLALRAARVEQTTTCATVWWDGVHARNAGGIGSHYDHSDNFVLQQTGSKLWRLGPPTTDPSLRERMLEYPAAGLYDMPNDAHEFLLEPGDLLYIPLFWGHWGISTGGTSTSVSLVLNADSGLDLILPLLRSALDVDPLWWRPVPVIPMRERGGEPPEVVQNRLEAMLETLADPAVRAKAAKLLWQNAFVKTRTQREEEAAAIAAANPYSAE